MDMVRYNSTGSIDSCGNVVNPEASYRMTADQEVSRESQVIQMEMDMIMELHNQQQQQGRVLLFWGLGLKFQIKNCNHEICTEAIPI